MLSRILLRHSFALALLLTCSAALGETRRPNVVLIMVDDMGFSDLGSFGGEIETPNLDELAAQGLRFSQFYNAAKCRQSRASLMSGLYPDEVGQGALENSWTLAEAMREASYFTFMTGKWHLSGEPTDRGFDRYFGHLGGYIDYFRGDPSFRLNGRPFQVPTQGFYATDAHTDYAIRFIDESLESGRPFFGYIAYNAPHFPLQAPREDVEKYRGRYRIGWDELRKRRNARQRELGILSADWPLSPRPDDVRPWDRLSEREQRQQDLRMATYAAMVDRVDQNVGRLVKHLEQRGQLDDTLILFLSDNGASAHGRPNDRRKMPWEPGSYWTYDQEWAHACNTPFRRYKREQHEGGIATPLIAHWPTGLGAEPNSINHEPGHLVDIMATLLDLTGTPYPEHYRGQSLAALRGKSLLPTLAGRRRELHDALYFDWANRHRALRQGRWKLVSLDRGPWELYDMHADRTELNDLAASKPKLVAKMARLLRDWAIGVGIDADTPQD